MVLVFELMEGGDLFNYMRRQGTTAQQIALGEDEARHIFHQVSSHQPLHTLTHNHIMKFISAHYPDGRLQILSGVGYAHNQHICHRDLKLENILLKGRTLAHVKIADFGLSDFYR